MFPSSRISFLLLFLLESVSALLSQPSTQCVYDLTRVERTACFQLLPSISAITFYETAEAIPTTFLRARAQAAVDANPWLGGTLRRGGFPPVLRLALSQEKRTVDFNEKKCKDLSPATPWKDIMELTKGMVVKIARDCVNNNEPLFRVTVLKCQQNCTQPELAPRNVFALLVSMSHVLGDGATFYEIASMLGSCSAGRLRTLDAFPRSWYEANCMRPKYEAWRSRRILAGCIGWTVVDTLWPGSRFQKQPTWRLVDARWIKDCKKVASLHMTSQQDRLISTNDIIMAWLLYHGRYTLGLMAIDLRSLVDTSMRGDGDFIAGNLESALTVVGFSDRYEKDKEEEDSVTFIVELAIEIRRCLEAFRCVGGAVDPAQHPHPRSWREALRSNHIFVSNWASVTKRIELENCKQILHLPLLDPSAGQRATAIIFEATIDTATEVGTTALLIADRRRNIWNDLFSRNGGLLTSRQR